MCGEYSLTPYRSRLRPQNAPTKKETLNDAMLASLGSIVVDRCASLIDRVCAVARIWEFALVMWPFWSVPKIQIECRFDRPWRFSNTSILLYECSYLLPEWEISSFSICHVRRLPLNGIFVAHRSCSLETTVSLFLLVYSANRLKLSIRYTLPTHSVSELRITSKQTIGSTNSEAKDRHEVIS